MLAKNVTNIVLTSSSQKEGTIGCWYPSYVLAYSLITIKCDINSSKIKCKRDALFIQC